MNLWRDVMSCVSREPCAHRVASPLRVALVVCACFLLLFAAQERATLEERWKDLLAALDPSRPLDYLLLG